MVIIRRPSERVKKRKYKSPYLEPVPPVQLVRPLSSNALSLLMEVYYYSYISEDRLSPTGRITLTELERGGLAYLSNRGDPYCKPQTFPYRETKKMCRYVVLSKAGMRYARWIEVQSGKHLPHITPNAAGLRYFGL